MSKNVLKSLKSLNLPHPTWKKGKNNHEQGKQNKKKKIFKGLRELIPNMGNFFSHHSRQQNVIENVDEYATNLMDNLTQLRSDHVLCDVMLNNKELTPAHKVVVSFNQKLLDMVESSSQTVALVIEEADAYEEAVTKAESNSQLPEDGNIFTEDKPPRDEEGEKNEDEVNVEEQQLSSKPEEEAIEENGLVSQLKTDKLNASEEEEQKLQDDNKISTKEEENVKEKLNDDDKASLTEDTAEETITAEAESNEEEAFQTTYEEDKTEVEEEVPEKEDLGLKDESTAEKKDKDEKETSGSANIFNETQNEHKDMTLAPPLSAELSNSSITTQEEENKENQCREDEESQGKVPSSVSDPLDVLINFLYTSHIDITQKNVTPLRVVATQCDMEDVITACNEFDKVLHTETESMSTNEEKDKIAGQFRYRYSDPTMPSKMLQHFQKMCQEKKFTDVKVKSSSSDILIDAHAVILACGSKFFEPIVSSESQQDVIDVTEIEGSALEPLIGFMYAGKLGISEQTVSKLIQAADRMQLHDVIEGCAEFLECSLSIQNCIQHRSVGIDYKCDKLKEAASNFIAEHFNDVVHTSDFFTLSIGSLLEITKSNKLCLDFPLAIGEMAIFNAVRSWVCHDEENRKQHLAQVMSAVRFPLISERHLLDDVTTDLMVMSNQEVCDRITRIISAKSNLCFDEPVSARGSECIVTTGGSYPVADETSEERGYQAVTYSNQFTVYDTNGTFHELSTLPETRALHCVAACDQYIFVVGGFDSYSCIVNTVYCFDITNGVWKIMPKMKIKRSCFSLHLVSGYLFAVGGLTPKGYTATVERLDRKRNVWAFAKPLPSTRYRHAGCVLGHEIIVSGGHEKQDTVFSYTPDADEWKKVRPLNVGRDSHTMLTVDEKAYAMGGDGIPFSAEVYINLSWTMLTGPRTGPKQLYLPGAAVIDDKIYLAGGWCDENEIVHRVRTYNTTTCEWQDTDHLMPIPRGSSSSCTIRMPKNYWKVRFNPTKFDSKES